MAAAFASGDWVYPLFFSVRYWGAEVAGENNSAFILYETTKSFGYEFGDKTRLSFHLCFRWVAL